MVAAKPRRQSTWVWLVALLAFLVLGVGLTILVVLNASGGGGNFTATSVALNPISSATVAASGSTTAVTNVVAATTTNNVLNGTDPISATPNIPTVTVGPNLTADALNTAIATNQAAATAIAQTAISSAQQATATAQIAQAQTASGIAQQATAAAQTAAAASQQETARVAATATAVAQAQATAQAQTAAAQAQVQTATAQAQAAAIAQAQTATALAANAVFQHKQILYSSTRNGTDGVYVYNVDNNQETFISGGVSGCSEASWSPDARQVVMQCKEGGGKNGVYKVNSDGSGIQRLTNGANPGWSPDGGSIVFTSNKQGECNDNDQIYVLASNGSGSAQRLTCDANKKLGPHFSPDGSQIAYSEYQVAAACKLVIIDSNGSGKRTLNLAVASARFPVWSPDGRQLAFNNGDGSGANTQVWVVNADGSNLKQLTSGSSFNGRPRWTRDGLIIFHSNRGRGANEVAADGSPLQEVYIMHTDGSQAQRAPIPNKFDNWTPEIR